MSLPARVDGYDVRGSDRNVTDDGPSDELQLQRDLATVRVLRSAGVEDVALLAAGLGEEPLQAIRAVLRRFRSLSGLPDLSVASPPSDHP